MYYENEKGAFGFLAGFAIGAILGASIALLAAPQSGKRTRRQIVRAVGDARRTATHEFGGVADRMQRTVRRRRRRNRR